MGVKKSVNLIAHSVRIVLVANVMCLVLITKKRDRGAHTKASYIFSANDVNRPGFRGGRLV